MSNELEIEVLNLMDEMNEKKKIKPLLVELLDDNSIAWTYRFLYLDIPYDLECMCEDEKIRQFRNAAYEDFKEKKITNTDALRIWNEYEGKHRKHVLQEEINHWLWEVFVHTDYGRMYRRVENALNKQKGVFKISKYTHLCCLVGENEVETSESTGVLCKIARSVTLEVPEPEKMLAWKRGERQKAPRFKREGIVRLAKVVLEQAQGAVKLYQLVNMVIDHCKYMAVRRPSGLSEYTGFINEGYSQEYSPRASWH